MKIIEYNGETLETKHYQEINEEEYKKLKEQYYTKPDYKNVKKQFINISRGGTKNNEITNYYVKDLMAKTRIYYNKWSIEDVFNCKDLVSFFIGKTLDNKKIFPDTDSTIKKIETAMRLGGKGVASKPANFPIKTCDEIIERYNVNNNWYDFSCGWGARLTSALKNKVNYYGTDPNYLLTDRLNQLANDYKDTLKQDTIVDIRTQGSEKFNADWVNTMGLAFSSPPYFYLEDYKIGNQSYKEGTTYQQWLDNYLEPTIKNIYQYLIKEGYLLFNINNFDKYNLVEDVKKIAIKNGFKYIGMHTLKNIKRTKSTGGFNDNSEQIMIFIKNENGLGCTKEENQMTIFDYLNSKGDE